MAALPDMATSGEIMVLTKLLSERSTHALGDYDVQHAFDPITEKALDK